MAGVGAVVIVAATLVARRQPAGAAASLVDQVRPIALWLAFVIAAVATVGSLYYSESVGYTPCRYCWFQRIAMYPQALILGIAAFRRDATVKLYLIPLSIIGGLISAYHYYIERNPEAGGSCSVSVPCNVPWFEQWGFVTLAFMALTGFAAIIALLSVADRQPHDQDVSA
ncbi:MAG: disulfide bond formation protein B [Acidimicrobiia bacterium]|nr:disulfide bond formation protein B [Acidimicrobiia bacterium]